MRPDHEPRMAYVLMAQHGPVFTHADFEIVAQRAVTLMRGDAEDTMLFNEPHYWIKKVEAE